ncbi:MAG: DegT/DnrJ/EryC1/StrS family aminotransferase [Rhodospirillales bacterium]|jgi:perosamine synthetase|nr:DegT/DnrJ/EryC1/StrS family aminotransferase [Rhodospirillales bacterium]
MKLPFPDDARKEYYSLLDQVFDSNMWSEGAMQRRFEDGFGAFVDSDARAVTNAGAGLLAIFQYLNIAGGEVILPTNTFWATTRAVVLAGGTPVFADIGKDDLCLSPSDIEDRITPLTKAIVVVHIGGHIAFEIDKIVELCASHNIPLVEDCAHAHGATWKNQAAGTFGFAGSYSFYATKSLPTGDGGMVVSRNANFLSWLEKWRNYGKEVIAGTVTYPVKDGFNYRMNEFTAALGIVQLQRFPQILEWKRELATKFDQIFEERVQLPEGSISGFYKYIVWGGANLAEKTGQVFGPGDLNHWIYGSREELPVAEWVAENHQCAPIWYGWENADKSVDELSSILGVSA